MKATETTTNTTTEATATETATETTTTETTTTEATNTTTNTTTEATTLTSSDFVTKHFTAYKVAIDNTKSITLYKLKLKDYNTSYIIGLSNLTVYIKTSDDVMKYLKNRLKQAKESNSQTAVQNWLSYYKPLQKIALQEYKKIFVNFNTKKQFDLSCCGEVKLISPSDNEGITIRKNIFMRPILKVNDDNKKTVKADLTKNLTALQNALLSDSNAKIKKRISNILTLWQYDLSFMSVDAEGIKLLKNLGCLSGTKGDRKNQTKTTLLNKVIECVYTRRKRINTNNADNGNNTNN